MTAHLLWPGAGEKIFLNRAGTVLAGLRTGEGTNSLAGQRRFRQRPTTVTLSEVTHHPRPDRSSALHGTQVEHRSTVVVSEPDHHGVIEIKAGCPGVAIAGAGTGLGSAAMILDIQGRAVTEG